MKRRAVVYARLSVSRDESVSIDRQLARGRAYADSQGWEVIGEFVDDGVSATKNKPDDREGWQALLSFAKQYDHVIIWKIDRLARRVVDFVNADESLQARGAGLVSIKESLDLSTDIGRMIAMILATFAQMEAKNTGERGADARRYLIANGRRAGGRPPYGYANIDNPDGPGKVLSKSDEIIHVQRAVDMVLGGESLGSVVRYFNANAPMRKRANRKVDIWEYAAIETILSNPVLAGMVPYTPGRKAGEKTTDVLRDDTGMPVIYEDLAIMSIAEYRSLLKMIETRKMPGTRTNPEQQRFLGLIKCHCGETMYKATGGNGYKYLRCKRDGNSISQPNVEQYVYDQAMSIIGDMPVLEDVTEPNRIDEIETAIADTVKRMQIEATPELFERLTALQNEKRIAGKTVPTHKVYDTKLRYRDLDNMERLKDVLTIVILPSTKRSNRFDSSRVRFDWSDEIAMIIPALKTNA